MDTTDALTFGQLAIWRDVEHVARDRWHEPNLTQTWPLPPGTSTASVRAALAAVAARHESLRTTYDLSDPEVPRQVAHPPGRYPVEVEDRDGTGGGLAGIVAERTGRAFHLGSAPAWRASVVSHAGSPTHLVIVAHHIVADRAGLLSLRRDFLATLDRTLEPPPLGPGEIRRYEQSPAGQRWNAEALGYWEQVLARSATPPQVEDVPLVEATTAAPGLLEAAERAARGMRVPLAALLLAAYCAGLSLVDGPDQGVVRLLSANRFEPRRARVVTSMNQWIGMVFDREPAPEFTATVREVAGRARMAYARGVYDVDRLFAMLAGTGYRPGQYDSTWSFNFMPGYDGPSPVPPDGDGVSWCAPPSSVGPRNYLRVTAGAELALVLRVPDVPAKRAAATRVLSTMRRLLDGTAGS